MIKKAPRRLKKEFKKLVSKEKIFFAYVFFKNKVCAMSVWQTNLFSITEIDILNMQFFKKTKTKRFKHINKLMFLKEKYYEEGD